MKISSAWNDVKNIIFFEMTKVIENDSPSEPLYCRKYLDTQCSEIGGFLGTY